MMDREHSTGGSDERPWWTRNDAPDRRGGERAVRVLEPVKRKPKVLTRRGSIKAPIPPMKGPRTVASAWVRPATSFGVKGKRRRAVVITRLTAGTADQMVSPYTGNTRLHDWIDERVKRALKRAETPDAWQRRVPAGATKAALVARQVPRRRVVTAVLPRTR